MVLAAEDALIRCAPSQACYFFSRSLTLLEKLTAEFVPVKAKGTESKAKNKVDSFEAEYSIEAAVAENNPNPTDSVWATTMERHVIRRLSRSHSLVRTRNPDLLCRSLVVCC
jgi:hypothetical protein